MIHNEVQPFKDPALNTFVTVEHWLIVAVMLTLVLRDSGTFTDSNYVFGDLALLGVTALMALFIVKGAFAGCWKDLCGSKGDGDGPKAKPKAKPKPKVVPEEESSKKMTLAEIKVSY